MLFNRPDLVHVSAPGMMINTVIFYAHLLRIPVVVSYHTHIPEYIPRYKLWKGASRSCFSALPPQQREVTKVCVLFVIDLEKVSKETNCSLFFWYYECRRCPF